MTDQVAQQAPTITIDGEQHELSKFSADVQRLVAIHQRWEQKAVEDRLEAARSDAAVREITRELTLKVKAELEPVEQVVAEEVAVA